MKISSKLCPLKAEKKRSRRWMHFTCQLETGWSVSPRTTLTRTVFLKDILPIIQ